MGIKKIIRNTSVPVGWLLVKPFYLIFSISAKMSCGVEGLGTFKRHL